MFYVYILLCHDNTFYIGSTNNIEKRVHQHNFAKNGAHYTKFRRPVSLVYFEEAQNYAQARAREAALKRLTRAEKEKIVNTKKEN